MGERRGYRVRGYKLAKVFVGAVIHKVYGTERRSSREEKFSGRVIIFR